MSKKAKKEVSDAQLDSELFAELDELLLEEESKEESSPVILDDLEDLEDLDTLIEVADAKAAAYESEETEECVAPAKEESADEIDSAVDILEARESAYASEEPDEILAPAEEVSLVKRIVLEKTALDKKKKRSASVTHKGLEGADLVRAKLGADLTKYLTLEVSDADLTEEAKQSSAEETLALIDTLPIKVKEKVINLLDRCKSGKPLSNYTKMALKLLVEKKEITSKDIIEVYLAHPYTQGTSNSQAGQIMKLLPALKIATRVGNRLTLNEGSALIPLLS